VQLNGCHTVFDEPNAHCATDTFVDRTELIFWITRIEMLVIDGIMIKLKGWIKKITLGLNSV